MKTFMVTLTLLLLQSAFGHDAPPVRMPLVAVCVEGGAYQMAMLQGQTVAYRVLLTAGLAVRWYLPQHCPSGAIEIKVSLASRTNDHPHAYAYSLPFDGVHIVLFWDRIIDNREPRAVPFLLGYVMVHEIVHQLQGLKTHAERGIMKPSFSGIDIGEMICNTLRFTPEDIRLIQAGIAARRARHAGLFAD